LKVKTKNGVEAKRFSATKMFLFRRIRLRRKIRPAPLKG